MFDDDLRAILTVTADRDCLSPECDSSTVKPHRDMLDNGNTVKHIIQYIQYSIMKSAN